MKLKTLSLFVAVALATGGCATSYDKYLAQVDKVNTQLSQEAQVRDAARQLDTNKIAEVAAGGGDSVKVAAALAIAMQNMVSDLAKGRGGNGSNVVVPTPPRDPLESFVALAGVVLPTAVQGFGIAKNASVLIEQSRNQALVEQSRNQTFSAIATAGINGVASVNVQPNVTTTLVAGGDALAGNNNSVTRRNCVGGSAFGTGYGGNAAPGGNGGNGTTTGGAGAASGAAGSTNPGATAGPATC